MRFALLSVLIAFSLVVALPIASADSVSRTFSDIKPALPKTITENVLSPAGTPVYEMRIDVLRTVVQARITLDSTDANSANLSVLPGGAVYSYVNVTTKNMDSSDVDSFKMKFRVAKAWMAENGVSANSVRMLRLEPDGWNELETAVVSDEQDRVTYEATSPGFSIFAIAGESSVTVPEESDEIVDDNSSDIQQTETPQIIETTPDTDYFQKREQQNLFWIIVGVVVAAVIAALFIVPGKIFRKSSFIKK